MIFELTTNGQYLLRDDVTDRVLSITDEVALCYDSNPMINEHPILLKYGDPIKVREYYEYSINAFSIISKQLGIDIRYIVGKFDVDELNALISTTGYINIFLKRYEYD